MLLVTIDIKADKSYIQKEVPIVYAAIEEKDDEDEELEDEIKVSDVKHFPLSYWLVTGSCVMMYMSFMSFMNVGSDFLQNRFSLSEKEAGVVLVKYYTFKIKIEHPLYYCCNNDPFCWICN